MLRFGNEWTSFAANGELSEIFYDNLNKKIITVRGDEDLDIIAKGLSDNDIVSFSIKNSGKIRVIKFSPDLRLVLLQFSDSAVDIVQRIALTPGEKCSSITITSKGRFSRIIGLEWISINQFVLITNQGFELHRINATRMSSKLLKSCNLSLYWYVFHVSSKLFIASSGASGSLMNPIIVQNGVFHRLPSFEVDFGCSTAKTNLLEREVTIASAYGDIYLFVLRYSLRDSSISDIVLYKLSIDSTDFASLTDTLLLDRRGALAVHVIDNVIVVHHQMSGQSMLFDIRECNNTANKVVSHRPLIVTSISRDHEIFSILDEVPIYSPSWVFFYPNIIVDARIGLFATVMLNLEENIEYCDNKCKYIHFLLNRCSMKTRFLYEFRMLLLSRTFKLDEILEIFRRIVRTQVKPMELVKTTDGNKLTINVEAYQPLQISQNDLISNVFIPISESQKFDKKLFVDYMIHYLLVLKEYQIDVQPYFLNEILISSMIRAADFSRLQQFLQFRIIDDAKQIAFQLLLHEAKHVSLIQLALDMLIRLHTSTEEIVEVLLTKGYVVEALRFLDSTSSMDKVNLMKILEVAWKEERQIRYAAFTFLREKLNKLRLTSSTNSSHYADYLKRFNDLFTDEEIDEARRASMQAKVLCG